MVGGDDRHGSAKKFACSVIGIRTRNGYFQSAHCIGNGAMFCGDKFIVGSTFLDVFRQVGRDVGLCVHISPPSALAQVREGVLETYLRNTESESLSDYAEKLDSLPISIPFR